MSETALLRRGAPPEGFFPVQVHLSLEGSRRVFFAETLGPGSPKLLPQLTGAPPNIFAGKAVERRNSLVMFCLFWGVVLIFLSLLAEHESLSQPTV